MVSTVSSQRGVELKISGLRGMYCHSDDGLATLTMSCPPTSYGFRRRLPGFLSAFFVEIAWPANLFDIWQHLYGNRADFIRIRKDIFIV